MSSPFNAYIVEETDAAVLSALSGVIRQRLTRATATTVRLREELATAEATERESAGRLMAISERRKALHEASTAPERAALAASQIDVDLGPSNPAA